MFAIRALPRRPVHICTTSVRRAPVTYTPVRTFTQTTMVQGNKYGDNFQSQSHRERDAFSVPTSKPEQVVTPKGRAPAAETPWTRLSFTPKVERSPQEISAWRAENEISLQGKVECPDPILTFDEAPFSNNVIQVLSKKFEAPLPIQSQGWSLALSGANMVGCADTGSGKTVAFLLPAFEHIAAQGPRRRGQGPTALVVAPTRELAQQIEAEAAAFARAYYTTTACLFGGQGTRQQQLRALSRSPGLVIATPGRLMDLADSGYVNISSVSFLVLDEADRMLDMGFGEDIKRILERIQPDRQTCMWTATWPKAVDRLAKDYFDDYARVNIGSAELTANPNVKQVIEVTNINGKLHLLTTLLQENPDAKILIFAGTKYGCDNLGSSLYRLGNEEVAVLHGDKSQAQRDNILRDLKSGALKCVIATDVASRGLDVKDIDIVVNYDFPQTIETYIHRIGRTARAGKTGTAITYFTAENAGLVDELIDVLKEAKQDIPSDLMAMRKQRGGSGNGGRGGSGYGGGRGGSGYGGGRGGSGYGGRGGSKYGDGFSSRGFSGNRQGGFSSGGFGGSSRGRNTGRSGFSSESSKKFSELFSATEKGSWSKPSGGSGKKSFLDFDDDNDFGSFQKSNDFYAGSKSTSGSAKKRTSSGPGSAKKDRKSSIEDLFGKPKDAFDW